MARVVSIYHNGAQVNSVLPYSSLYNSNVYGTISVLTLALSILPRFPQLTFFHVSTIGILAGTGIRHETKQVPPNSLSYFSGYSQSKWVSEQLVLKAFEKGILENLVLVGVYLIDVGISGHIFRPGTISGDSKTGACNMHDSCVLTMLGNYSFQFHQVRENMIALILV